MPPIADRSLSVTEASRRGVSSLLRDAEEGRAAIVERHGRPVAAIVGMRHLAELKELEADLRSATLVLARMATDSGERTSLDELIAGLGFDRTDLERELDDELEDR